MRQGQHPQNEEFETEKEVKSLGIHRSLGEALDSPRLLTVELKTPKQVSRSRGMMGSCFR